MSLRARSRRPGIATLCFLGLALGSSAPAGAAVDPAYLAESGPEVIWSLPGEPDLRSMAEQLATPVAMYELVRNDSEFVVYHGARSSSVNSFLGRRGNDVDLASTLIAMLRSRGIPARYASGIVRIPSGQAVDWLGIRDLDLAAAILDDQGIQAVAIAPDRSWLELEHVWVQALVAQDRYRGAGAAASVDCAPEPPECAWIDLDPSFKLHEPGDPAAVIDIHGVVEFDYDAYYSARVPGFVAPDGIERRDKNPLEIYEEQVLAWLRQTAPGKTLADVAASAPVQRVHNGLLPSSLPFAVLPGSVQTWASVAEHDQAALPAWEKHLTMRIDWAPGVTFASSPAIPLAELSTKRLTYTYELGSPERMVARLGGEEVWVPLTVGSLTINGEEVGLGHAFDLVLTLDGAPATQVGAQDEAIEATYTDLLVGGYFLVAAGGETSNWSQVHRASQALLDANAAYPTLSDPDGVLFVDEDADGTLDPGEAPLLDHPEAQDALTGGLLWVAQALYYARLRDAGERLGELNHVITPISGFLGVISTVHEVESVAGTAFSILPGGLLIDMKGIRVNGSWRIDAPAEYSNRHFELLGTIASALEHEVWQELTGFDALSTTRGIQDAVGEGNALLNPRKTATESTLASMYAPLGFAAQAPPVFDSIQTDLFGMRVWTWRTTSGTHSFRVLKEVVDGGTPDLQRALWTLTWDDTASLGQLDERVGFWNSLEDQLLAFIAAGQSIQPFTPCAGQGPFTDPALALVGIEVCFWQEVDTAGWRDYIDYFDENKLFSASGYAYRSYPRVAPDDLDLHSAPFVASVRNDVALVYDQTAGEERVEYLLSGRKPSGPFHRFQVYLRKSLVGEEIAGLSFEIANDPFGAAGGYVNGEEALLLSDGSVFNNEVLTDRSLVGLANNDRVKTPSTSDPISTVTGNLFIDETDVTVKGRGLHFAFTRSYNSGPTDVGAAGVPMGHGWTHSYNLRLRANDFDQSPNLSSDDGIVSSITYVDERGGESIWGVSGAGPIEGWTLTRPRGVFSDLDLSQAAAQSYVLRFRNGVEYAFGGADLRVPGAIARLERIRDPFGNEMIFTYTAGRLTGVSDGLEVPGRTGLTLAYDPSGRLAVLGDWTGRAWTYGYDSAGNLTSVTNPLAETTLYAYAPGTHDLVEVVLPADRDGDGQGGDVRTSYAYYRNGKAFRNANAFGDGETVDYDLFRRRTRITDARGRIRTHFYDRNGALTKLTEPDGGILLFEHGADGLRYSKRDALGYETRYSWCAARSLDGCASDTGGNVTLERNPLGHAVETDYGIFDQPTRIRDRNGNEVLLTYYGSTDAAAGAVAGKLERREIVGLDGFPDPVRLLELTYHPDGTLREQREYIDPADPSRVRVTEHFWGDDGLNLERTETRGSGQTIVREFSYDALGRLETETLWRRASFSDPTPIPIQTRHDYDALDRETRRTDPLGNEFVVVYDENGQVERRIERYLDLDSGEFAPDRVVERREYDAADRLVRRLDPLGNATAFAYDEGGNLVAVTDANGHTTRYAYDAMSRRTSTIDANGHRSSTRYDLAGRPVAHVDPNGNETLLLYDAAGRLIRTIDPLGFETELRYDANGNVTHRLDANATAGLQPTNAFGATEYREYDALDRPVRAVDALGGETRFTYDLLGNRTSVTDAEGRNTSFAYDDLGRLIEVHDPLVETPVDWITVHTWDEAGNRIRTVDRKGQETRLSYDALDRLVQRELLADGEEETFAYDGFGDLVRAENPTVAYDLAWDGLHRLRSRTESRFGRSLSYAYDAVGNRIRKTDYQGDVTEYQYDGANRLVALWSREYLQVSYHYDPAGRLLNRILSSGAQTDYRYDAAGRLTRLQSRTADGSAVLDLDYTGYDRIGNLTGVEDAAGASSFAYDPLYRLTQADFPGTADDEVFTYDGVGNRSTWVLGGAALSYSYDAGNRLKAVHSGLDPTADPQLFSFDYDANGNLETKRDELGSPVQVFSHDQKNRVRALLAGGQLLSFGYDTDDFRVVRTSASGTRHDLLEAEHLEAVYDDSGSLISSYLRGTVIDEVVSGWVHAAGATESYSFHEDHLRSVLGVSGHAGQLIETRRYRAFGGEQSAEGSSLNDLLYTGRQLDRESGLYYYRARYYDPALGRFLSEDPLGFGAGINFYAYADNNPLRFFDPLGLDGASAVVNLNASFIVGGGGTANLGAFAGNRYVEPEGERFYFEDAAGSRDEIGLFFGGELGLGFLVGVGLEFQLVGGAPATMLRGGATSATFCAGLCATLLFAAPDPLTGAANLLGGLATAGDNILNGAQGDLGNVGASIGCCGFGGAITGGVSHTVPTNGPFESTAPWPTSPSPTISPAAGGGFLLYPGRQNANGVLRAYRKV